MSKKKGKQFRQQNNLKNNRRNEQLENKADNLNEGRDNNK